MDSPASSIDHTLLKPDATLAEIHQLCEEAVEYGFASVCVPPRFVAEAAARLYGSASRVGTVIGFPLGYEPTAVKVFEVQAALRAGARELDMVIQLGAARSGAYPEVSTDIRAVVAAAAGVPVKAILETCLFDSVTQVKLVEAAVLAGATFVKTSTGFAAAGAALTDVRTLVAAAGGRIQVKASGGIRDWAFCAELLNAGATRIGTSAGVAIMQQWHQAAPPWS
jgi:deoxyribose-phosphate aldolase